MAEAPQLVFRVSESVCGIPLAAISEVSLPGPLSRIPKAAPPLLGIVNLRGRIVVVADLGLLLGREPASRGQATERLLVLQGGRRDLAVLVSEVLSIANLGAGGEEAAEPEPETAETFTGEELAARVSALLEEAAPALASKGS
jgi:purine-binding chemotaxis protein CheW